MPVRIRSDVPFIGRIDTDFDHSFSCEVDGHEEMHPLGFSVDFYEQNPQFEWEKKRPKKNQVKKMAPWNALKIDRSFWQQNKVYTFECKVQYHSKETGVQYRGKAARMFTSRVFSGPLNFTVSPKVGIPFETGFSLEIPKQTKLKCEFGYKNDIGRVVIPTSDTKDMLLQSEEYL